ncbi:hypothetical protein F5I97DRAFT_1477623 [Phlebopus sp. FC_14]|nr:hypothetical protein F5I97DRAFT_1477623 [Phlebopus sp. FC_14]
MKGTWSLDHAPIYRILRRTVIFFAPSMRTYLQGQHQCDSNIRRGSSRICYTSLMDFARHYVLSFTRAHTRAVISVCLPMMRMTTKKKNPILSKTKSYPREGCVRKPNGPHILRFLYLLRSSQRTSPIFAFFSRNLSHQNRTGVRLILPSVLLNQLLLQQAFQNSNALTRMVPHKSPTLHRALQHFSNLSLRLHPSRKSFI